MRGRTTAAAGIDAVSREYFSLDPNGRNQPFIGSCEGGSLHACSIANRCKSAQEIHRDLSSIQNVFRRRIGLCRFGGRTAVNEPHRNPGEWQPNCLSQNLDMAE
jgi:hypothetical protein